MLVGHGTRDQIGTDQFFELGQILGNLISPVPVQPCLLELQPPTIDDGWRSLMERRVRHVHVAPLLLFSAGHAKRDIPDAITTAASATPDVTYDFSRPLSRHPAIVELSVRRIMAKLQQLDSLRDTAVIMVGRGSHDPCARSDMFVLTEVVKHRINQLAIESDNLDFVTCFYAMAQPRLPDVLQIVAADERIRRVVVYSHLLFEGRLYQAIKQQVAGIANQFTQKKFLVCDYLGPDPLVAEAISGRAFDSVALGRSELGVNG